jgi:hypothetical protein
MERRNRTAWGSTLSRDSYGPNRYKRLRMGVQLSLFRRPLLCGALMLALGLSPVMAGGAPPSPGPKNYTTTTAFTLAWAKRLRGFRSIWELQQAAGSKGSVSDRHMEGDDPHVSYHWRSEPPETGALGYKLATLRPDGRINVSIMTTQNEEVVLDNRGGFELRTPDARE